MVSRSEDKIVMARFRRRHRQGQIRAATEFPVRLPNCFGCPFEPFICSRACHDRQTCRAICRPILVDIAHSRSGRRRECRLTRILSKRYMVTLPGWKKSVRGQPRRLDRMEGQVSATLGTMCIWDDALLPFNVRTTIHRPTMRSNGSERFPDIGNNSKRPPSYLLAL